MRYELRPQQHSDAYPYDGGWAIYDTVERRQVGFVANRARAEVFLGEMNLEGCE